MTVYRLLSTWKQRLTALQGVDMLIGEIGAMIAQHAERRQPRRRRSRPRRVGARNDPPATLALDRGGSARRAEPKGRVDDLEIVKPQKAK